MIFLSSYWLEWGKKHKSNNIIDGDYVADVAIVGAGIFGLTARILFIKKRLKSNCNRKR